MCGSGRGAFGSAQRLVRRHPFPHPRSAFQPEAEIGLHVVMGPAHPRQVIQRGWTAVGEGLDVVDLQTVPVVTPGNSTLGISGL